MNDLRELVPRDAWYSAILSNQRLRECFVPYVGLQRRCDLCDMKKRTKYRIPSCKRPAKHKTLWVLFGLADWLHVCDYHFRMLSKVKR